MQCLTALHIALALRYLHMVEMYIRSRDIGSALAVKDEMAEALGSADAEVLGACVRKLADLDRLQEALLLLDEAQAFGVSIRER